MPKAARTRQACDRCHSQKLRCPKQHGSRACGRCSKAGADCVFSPVGGGGGRGGAPSARSRDGSSGDIATPTPIPPSHIVGHDEYDSAHNNLIDWSLLGTIEPLNPGMGMSFPVGDHDVLMQGHQQQLPELGNHNLSFPFPSAGHSNRDLPQQQQRRVFQENENEETSNSSATVTVAERLSALFSDIDKTLRSVPSRSLLHIRQTAPAHVFRERVAQLQSQCPRQTVENCFSHAQQLAELYPLAIREACSSSSSPDAACYVEDCIHHIQLPAGFDGPAASESRPPLDAALVGLLVACHTRFIDLVDAMFDNMHTCFKSSIAFPPEGKPEMDVPDLKVGSFVPSPESSTAMQVILLAHLLQTLATHAGKLSGVVQERCQKESKGRGSKLLALQAEHVEEMAVLKCDELKAMRETLCREGIIP